MRWSSELAAPSGSPGTSSSPDPSARLGETCLPTFFFHRIAPQTADDRSGEDLERFCERTAAFS